MLLKTDSSRVAKPCQSGCVRALQDLGEAPPPKRTLPTLSDARLRMVFLPCVCVYMQSYRLTE